MDQGRAMIEVWRGDHLESVHSGHAVICGAGGAIEAAWGAPGQVILPRSSSKMIQALPLLTSGAGRALSAAQLALACASHEGAALHRGAVAHWLGTLGLEDAALVCGAQPVRDEAERDRLIRAGEPPCRAHNNCSGKHAGYLTLAQHLGADLSYADIDHPVQRAVRAAFEDSAGEESPTWAIDGCSAPNFATSLHGLGRAVARFANADGHSGQAAAAMVRLREAMAAHPDLVAGQGRACTELMEAIPGAAIKTGAEGVFVAILPDQGLGIALKIADGATRAAEAAIVALLIRQGVLDPAHPAAQKRLGPIRNWDGVVTGRITAPGLAISG